MLSKSYLNHHAKFEIDRTMLMAKTFLSSRTAMDVINSNMRLEDGLALIAAD